jgi:tRNA-splicing ligase RtcB
VDIGCGMCALQTTLKSSDLPDDLKPLRNTLERAVPHGRSPGRKGGGKHDKGAWWEIPKRVGNLWKAHLADGFELLCERYRSLEKTNHVNHLGTLGTGNHFIEVCLDEEERVWFLLHSGSRGVGNSIATIFIERAKKDMEDELGSLPDTDLAYLREGTRHFDDYVEAVLWAQEFARLNRSVMMENVIESVERLRGIPRFEAGVTAVNCHHNYVVRERHLGADLWITRKGAVRAGKGELGIIPGSMGAKSFIVRGGQRTASSPSHGAGRSVARRGAALLARRPHRGHEARRVPQGRRRDRRDADGVQGHRGGHEGPGGPGRDRAHAAPGRVREGVRDRARMPLAAFCSGSSDRAGARSSRTLG